MSPGTILRPLTAVYMARFIGTCGGLYSCLISVHAAPHARVITVEKVVEVPQVITKDWSVDGTANGRYWKYLKTFEIWVDCIAFLFCLLNGLNTCFILNLVFKLPFLGQSALNDRDLLGFSEREDLMAHEYITVHKRHKILQYTIRIHKIALSFPVLWRQVLCWIGRAHSSRWLGVLMSNFFIFLLPTS